MVTFLLSVLAITATAQAQPYPPSSAITAVTFDRASHDRRAPGSDNWPMTWADDDHQYTSWGDGGGFGGTNSRGRVSLGVARVEGGGDSYTGLNVWGGFMPEAPADFGGKSYGILSVAGILYMWVSPGSGPTGYTRTTMHRSDDHGRSWTPATWSFTDTDDLVIPTILQFGRDYAGAVDDFVYSYAIRLQDDSDLLVQRPGVIDLMRVPRAQIMDETAYEFFAGLDGGGAPTWVSDVSMRQPAFEDPDGVGWNVSVSFNAGLGRYLLCTEHTTSFEGRLGIFDAPTPWGPWTTVLYSDADWEGFGTTFFWNFANKWVSADGRDFTLVFTGIGDNDSWNSIDGSFEVGVLPDAGVPNDGGTAGSDGGPVSGDAGSIGRDGSASVDAGDPATDDGGCGCRTTGGSSPAWPVALVLVALVFRAGCRRRGEAARSTRC